MKLTEVPSSQVSFLLYSWPTTNTAWLGYYPKYKDKMVRLVSDPGYTAAWFANITTHQAHASKCPTCMAYFPSKWKMSRGFQGPHIKPTSKRPSPTCLMEGSLCITGKIRTYESLYRCVPQLIRLQNQGRTNNLTHPAVGELCRIFFYGASNKLGHEFPDEFESEVPDMAVALVITAVSSMQNLLPFSIS